MFGPVVDKTIEEILNLRVALRRFAAAQTDPVVRFQVDCLDDGLATALVITVRTRCFGRSSLKM